MGLFNIKKEGIAKTLEAGKNLIDELFDSKEEKREATMKLLELGVKDRNSAREMFKADNSLQKIYALVFLIAYIGLTGWMIYMVYTMSVNNVNIGQFGTTFISTIWGAMSTKVSTITDFLFGGSQDSRDKDYQLHLKPNKDGNKN